MLLLQLFYDYLDYFIFYYSHYLFWWYIIFHYLFPDWLNDIFVYYIDYCWTSIICIIFLRDHYFYFETLFLIISIIHVVYCKIIAIMSIIESSFVLLTEHFPRLRAPVRTVPFITDHGTSPRPKSWQTTSCIHRPHLACGRRARPQRRCEGGAELFRCRRLEQLEVCPVYARWEWHKEQAFCGQARKVSESQPISTILH